MYNIYIYFIIIIKVKKMKTTTTIRIDSTILHKAKILNINVSQTTENTLKAMVDFNNDQNMDEIKINQEINDINDELIKLQTHKQELVSKKIAFDEKRKARQQQDFKKVKEMLDAAKRTEDFSNR